MALSKLAIILSIAAAVVAAPTPADSDAVSGFTFTVPKWDLEISPGRVETFEGTIEEAVAQAIALEPSFEKTFFETADAAVAAAEEAESKRSLSKRAVSCYHRGDWQQCSVTTIEQGVRYLRGVGGKPRLGAGPGACSRVSCSYNAAIFICNDKNYARDLPTTWDGVANSAQHTVNVCKRITSVDEFGNSFYSVLGQNFEADNWNTIVRRDSC